MHSTEDKISLPALLRRTGSSRKKVKKKERLSRADVAARAAGSFLRAWLLRCRLSWTAGGEAWYGVCRIVMVPWRGSLGEGMPQNGACVGQEGADGALREASFGAGWYTRSWGVFVDRGTDMSPAQRNAQKND
jgi:hypothetical protein